VLGWCYRAKGWEDDPNAYVYIVIQQDPHGFELFCHALGFEDWLDDPKFSTPNARDENKAAIYERVEAYTMQHDKLTLTKTLGERGVPIGPVMDWWELEHDPDLNADGTLVEIDQQDARGTFKTIGVPFTLESFTPTYTRAPQLGEHNTQILTELGYSDAEIAQFEAQGVIGHNTGAAADLLE
jgi:formyl-CoA transferase